MRLLVVGAGGLVGSNVVREGQDRDWDVSGTFHTAPPTVDYPLDHVDLSDANAIQTIFDDRQPDLVVNCAAMTDVDACERNLKRAVAVNGVAPGKLAAACKKRNIDFVHLSTDYVFDGEARQPYTEDDSPRPIQRYGASKYLGELKVQAAHPSALIARLSFVYGTRGDDDSLVGFPAWVREQLDDGISVPLFTGQFMTPTRASVAAETVCSLAATGLTGLFHVASRSCVTPYAFGKALCEQWRTGTDLLKQISSDDVDRPADRPRYSCLDVANVEAKLGRPQPPLAADIATLSAKPP